MRRTLPLLLAALLPLAVACGDDGGGGGGAAFTCADAPQPCGGDPTGTWSISATCRPPLAALDDCPDATVEVLEDRTSGTVTLSEGGQYDEDFTIDVKYKAVVPKACLNGATCEGVSFILPGVTCIDSGDTCDCNGNVVANESDSGTWVVEGTTIVFDQGTGSEEVSDFCVSGASAFSKSQSSDTHVIWAQ